MKVKKKVLLPAGSLILGLVATMAIGAPAVAQTATTAPAADTKSADLPSAEKVIERYIEAMGGETAIRKHKSVTLSGTMSVPGQFSGDLVIRAAAPNKFLATIVIEGMGEMRQGYDGTVGWALNPMMGAMLIEEEMLEELKREADFYADLNYAKTFGTMQVVEKTEFNGKPAYKMRLVPASGREVFEYFAVDSGLKIGSVSTSESPMGEVETTAKIEEYKTVDGVKVPVKLVVSQMGMDQQITLEKVEFDTVDASTFDLPSEIKPLLETEPAGAP